MLTKCSSKEIDPILDSKLYAKQLVSECENCKGTILLMDQDSNVLLEYQLLFLRAGFHIIKVRHPNQILTLFASNEYDANLIIASTEMQMMMWVDCLAMIRNSYNARLNLRTTPIILYGELPSGHFDTSFPNKHFLKQPSPEIMLDTALWILKQTQGI